MPITERVLIIITAIITAVAALFCLIALATPGWSGYGKLYCDVCPKAPGALSIIALILLIVGIVILVLLAFKILPESVRFLSILILFLATIFSLAAYASYFDMWAGYSFKLMIFAHFLCYIASLMAAFWLGGSYVRVVVAPAIP